MTLMERIAFAAYLVWVHFLEAQDRLWRRYMAFSFTAGERVFRLIVGKMEEPCAE